MKVAQINQVSGYGSTGRIAEDLSDVMTAQGIDNRILYGVGETSHPRAQKFGDAASLFAHKALARTTGRHGAGSRRQTQAMVRYLEQYDPDIVHLHNLHGFYLHLPTLFAYLKSSGVPVVWTLHDCWSFTGHCAHFSYEKCERWQTGCGQCPKRFAYPRSLVDASAHNWRQKQELFTGLAKCVLVTPSRWLADLTRKSFLAGYPVRVIPNGINTAVFAPQPARPAGPKLVLASARSLARGDRKGGAFLPELARQLGPRYRIQVLGLQEQAPPEIEALPYVQDKRELAEIYARAAVFVNPTLEDNFPTVNLEALACGTPVVTFATGGSPESLDESCGAAVPQEDVTAMAQAVRQWAEKDCTAACRRQALNYAKERCFDEYISLYQDIAGRR